MGIETLKIPIQSTESKPFIKSGDTIPKITFTFGVSDSVDLTTSTIKMQLYSGSEQVFSIDETSGITIVGAKVFEIDEVLANDNNFPEGVLKGDLEITDTNGVRFTYFNVEYTILKQYTIW